MPEFDLVVGTTAVTRGDFHEVIFKKYIKFLEGYSILWYINIDTLKGFSVEDSLFTGTLLESLCNTSNIDFNIKVNFEGGTESHFFNSVKYLINTMISYKPNLGYLWLEDDWGLIHDVTLKSLLERYTDFAGLDYLQLAKRVRGGSEISFNPGLWSPDLFFNVMYKNINSHNGLPTNPEDVCIPKKIKSIKLASSFYKEEYFQDLGRKWSSSLGLFRTFKDVEKNKI